ncbi:LacI family transcriptional regulator [Frondihabitans sucicola]|uniref:LacI family transcriptional regulator n=1 Tax=Frondihabitans sucicola TaxID=1268041 RepID=A0ABM8GTI3_9MICO|nr:LacI family DNA-binding transcriptional regulator [Frondihabitans sucicola]BDZ51779.1 LacI family transcriptional regulator [Frondihabitans sucicola]
MGDRPPAIDDVARLAGVSVTTVSRVLNGSAQVSDRRRAATLKAIETLGYRPNETARALASGRSRVIAVLTGDTTLYGFASAIQGIEDAALEHGVLVTVARVREPRRRAIRRLVDILLTQPLGGVIGIEFESSVSTALGMLPPSLTAVSASLVGTHLSGLPHSHMDDESGGRIATEHLLGLGHETVHHLAVDYPTVSGHGRTYGYLAALAAAGARVPTIEQVTWEPGSAEAAAARLLDDGATALFCFNDELALGAVRAVRARGLDVPRDVSVVGFDDVPVASVSSPSLTSVRMDFRGLGEAAYGLLRSITGAGSLVSSPDVELPASLVVRESSGPPART